MTKRLHPRLPRIFAQPTLAALLLLLCLNLPAYRVVETPVTANTWPDPPFVAVGSVVGDGSAIFHATYATDGHFDGTLASSNVKRNCTVTIDGQSAQVAFEWDYAGSRNFDYNDYFIPEEAEDVFFYPTLLEIAGEDANNNGIAGESAIDGHSMPFVVGYVTVQFWAYDLELDDYVDYGEMTVNVTPGTDPTVVYGLKVSDLIEIDATTELIPGKYKSVQTVYDDYFLVNDYYTEVQVIEYCFDVYDLDVFAP